MKNLLLLLTIFFSVECLAQELNQKIKVNPPKEFNKNEFPKSEGPKEIFQKVEIDAEFIGRDKAFKDFLIKNLKVSTPANNKAPKGNYTVIVRFIVDKKGILSEIVAETDPGFGCVKKQ